MTHSQYRLGREALLAAIWIVSCGRTDEFSANDSGGVSDRGDAGQGGVASGLGGGGGVAGELGGEGGVAGELAGEAGETSSAGSAGNDTGGRASSTGGKAATGGALATAGAAASGGVRTTGGGPCTPPDPSDPSAAYVRAIDVLPGAEGSLAFGVSGDGSIVVGDAAYPGALPRAFRWTEAQGTQLLDADEEIFSGAYAVSADGLVAAGRRFTEPGISYESGAVRFTNAGSEWLAPDLDPPPSAATGVNADGSVIVGHSGSDADPRLRVFRWENGEVEWLVPSADGVSYDPFVSADGRIVVAASSDGPFRWEHGEGYEILAPADSHVTLRALSDDGTTITGDMLVSGDDSHAFRWRDGVFEDLGKLGRDTSGGNAINADGSVIAGSSGHAMIWDRAHGMRSLATVLEDACVDLDGFSLQSVWGISDDGRTVVGDCCPGFIARLPEGFDAAR